MTFLRKMFEQIRSWFKLAEVGQSRSSITNPLQWALVIIGGLMLLAHLFGLPSWIVAALLFVLLGVSVIFIYTYLHFMHKSPDVLRSEHYHLSKMVIERGLVGDSLHGLIEESQQGAEPLKLEGGKK